MTEQSKKDKIQAMLNKKRKIVEESAASTSKPEADVKKTEIVDLTKNEKIDRAKKALLFEARRAKERAESSGPQGWLRPKSLATNKRFLERTIRSTLPREKRKKTE